MRKIIAMLLALIMVLPLSACGGASTPSAPDAASTAEADTTESNAADSSEENAEASSQTPETPEVKEYAIGEAFGTDNVECVITEIEWLTSEDFKSRAFLKTSGGNKVYSLDTELLFPDSTVWGITGFSESKISENSFLIITCTLQNTGKEAVQCEMKSDGGIGMMFVPYGTISVVYDDGYTFDVSDSGFTSGLTVLGDPIKEVGIINFPNQVLENEDKPVKLKVTLPNSNGETEEFIVSVR